jgi:hypothetical protein
MQLSIVIHLIKCHGVINQIVSTKRSNRALRDIPSQVCNLESFGPDTQSLADLRLASGLGDPGCLGRKLRCCFNGNWEWGMGF